MTRWFGRRLVSWRAARRLQVSAARFIVSDGYFCGDLVRHLYDTRLNRTTKQACGERAVHVGEPVLDMGELIDRTLDKLVDGALSVCADVFEMRNSGRPCRGYTAAP